MIQRICNILFISSLFALLGASLDVPAQVRIQILLDLPEAAPRPSSFTDEELACVARTVYGEAADQPLEGKLAVAAVIVNRSLRGGGAWPTDLCDVARQPGQFGGYKDVIRLGNFLDRRAYHEAQLAASVATEKYGTLTPEMRRATFFHEGKPRMRFQGQPMIAKLGDHVFYGSGS